MASKLLVNKSVGWFVVKTLKIHSQEKTQMIGKSQDMGFTLDKKYKEKWDLYISVNF